jgi:hypothetical protein
MVLIYRSRGLSGWDRTGQGSKACGAQRHLHYLPPVGVCARNSVNVFSRGLRIHQEPPTNHIESTLALTFDPLPREREWRRVSLMAWKRAVRMPIRVVWNQAGRTCHLRLGGEGWDEGGRKHHLNQRPLAKRSSDAGGPVNTISESTLALTLPSPPGRGYAMCAAGSLQVCCANADTGGL